MTARMVYTRWHRDRGGKLVLLQSEYRVIGEPGHAARRVALDTLAATAMWAFVLLLLLSGGGQ